MNERRGDSRVGKGLDLDVGPVDEFRPDLQGLRAVAVVIVLLYHCGFSLFSGGYVGVDMFFALSGFLMTGLLLRERESGQRISFSSFYARRIRRLLPASVLVLLTTALASWLLLYPLEIRDVSAQLGAAGAYVVNMFFARQGSDYLGADVTSSPVLHYWSLAVEEQFYLVWPILLALLLGAAKLRLARARIGLGALTVLSFGAAVVVTHRSQPWAFYSLPTRAWEFAIGGMAALAWSPLRRLASRSVSLIGWMAMAGLIGSVVKFDGQTTFPGPWAALPVVATTALILVGTGVGVLPGVLRWGPIQWIGDRSYSLYLWHWPALVLVPRAIGRPLEPWGNLVVVVGSGVIAAVTYEFVEQPLRFSTWLSVRKHAYGLGAMLTTVAVLVPVGLRLDTKITPTGPPAHADYNTVHGLVSVAMPDFTKPNPVPTNLEPSLRGTSDSLPSIYNNGCHVDFLVTEPMEPCRFGDRDSDFVVALFGDSHGAQWFPALEKITRDRNWALVSFTKKGCPSSEITPWNEELHREYSECELWRHNSIERLSEIRPDVVILANRPTYVESDGAVSPQRSARAAVATIEALGASAARIVEIGPIPRMDISPHVCLSGHLGDANGCALVRSEALPDVLVKAARSAAQDAGATFIDPTPWLCADKKCPVVVGQYLVYRDNSHISEEYARWLAKPLAAIIREALSL